VLIGTSGSGVSAAVMGDIVNAGLVMISPSATAATLSAADDKGFYFRTAPSDVLQARALADMIMRDGVRKVTLIGKNDTYGTGLVEGVQKELLAAGMSAASIQTQKFDIEGDKVKDPNQLAQIAGEVVAHMPDGVLIVGTSESAEMIKALAAGHLQIRH
jgi:ABC-type branched-subunit amino acid transport system substrate-binding protein